ncbi:cytochrome b/b6 domain-containing protein [Microbacterium sp. BWT-B31]|uniref:cytochrome b/b6 domain-containing protein n=1 Tax=Microbacterium sp. BWT-B31 TaxID=3232072 RepID=UPI0035280CD2
MATYGSTLRRGLPRVVGGDAWPPAGAAPDGIDDAAAVDSVITAAAAQAVPVAAAVEAVPAAPAAASAVAEPVAASSPVGDRALRRGLPRVPGGEPWPPAGVAPVGASVAPAGASATAPAAPAAAMEVSSAAAPAEASPTRSVTDGDAVTGAGRALRRGLPRTAGGDPWPPAGIAPGRRTAAASVAEAPARPVRAGLPRPGAATVPAAEAPGAASATAAAAAVAVAEPVGPRAPLPFTPSVWPGRAASTRPAPRPEPKRLGPFTRGQWAGAVIVGGFGLLFAAGMAVLLVRWLLSLDGLREFLATYPGEYHLPEGAPVGFPAWLGWQHFFNVFLMVLIIRSGLQVRTEKRPTAFWSPRGNPKRKISLNLWLHQSLDILWLVNGVIFVVLLFVTGQWLRIVPTSWEVFPNAISAALQYVSLDWPTENGWVNYNSLQQLAYFTTVFLAAPLAAATGVRMSGIWPKDAKALNKAYPVEWARAVHFPVMIYFVLFIFVHVVLVFATGALRNLNHMYGGQDAVNWTGFWIFTASLVVIAAAWVAARPLVLAPIAKLFGKVSGR